MENLGFILVRFESQMQFIQMFAEVKSSEHRDGNQERKNKNDWEKTELQTSEHKRYQRNRDNTQQEITAKQHRTEPN